MYTLYIHYMVHIYIIHTLYKYVLTYKLKLKFYISPLKRLFLDKLFKMYFKVSLDEAPKVKLMKNR